jgi:hypothetical protein
MAQLQGQSLKDWGKLQDEVGIKIGELYIVHIS